MFSYSHPIMEHHNVQNSTYIDKYNLVIYASNDGILSSDSQLRIMKHFLASVALPSLPLLLIIIQLLQTPTTILAQNSSLFDCPSKYANYTSGSQFESNLKTLLFPTLISNGSPKSFFNTSSGNRPNTVYGLVQCRPDVSMEDCQDCLKTSTEMIIQECPNKVDATIRFEKCMLRYSNIRFFSELNTSDLRYTSWYWTSDIPLTSLTVFNQRMGILLNNLSSTASLQPSKFMTGSISYNSLRKIYGFVDCTQDLSSADCLFCLQSMIQKVPGCCSGKEGGWVLSRSCEIWYRDTPLFQTLPPPPGLPFLPPITVPPFQPFLPPPITIPPFQPFTLPPPISINHFTPQGTIPQVYYGSKCSRSSPSIVVFIGSTLVGAAVLFVNIT